MSEVDLSKHSQKEMLLNGTKIESVPVLEQHYDEVIVKQT